MKCKECCYWRLLEDNKGRCTFGVYDPFGDIKYDLTCADETCEYAKDKTECDHSAHKLSPEARYIKLQKAKG